MGLAENLYPTEEELLAIKAIRTVLIGFLKLKYTYSSAYIYDNIKPIFDKHWGQIKYYRQSRFLSKLITSFERGVFINWEGYQIRYYAENILLIIWNVNYDTPSMVLEQVEYTKQLSQQKPTVIYCLSTMEDWIYKGLHYATSGPYTDEELSLLILEEFDKERRLFEKLRQKHISGLDEFNYKRQRIPETVRIEVWRRDGGKCARCGSRENLEYDHIVPVSRGGSNTARNIELLCEKCNRTKSNNIA